MTATGLTENFFRHEYARLVSVLTRRVGMEHLSAVEDAVQSALLTALERWKVDGLPNQPSAWLYKVARNNLMSEFRLHARRQQLLELAAHDNQDDQDADTDRLLAHDISDDLLRMLFVCCEPTIPPESQLVFALKTLCGFNIREISLRLFISEDNTYKRLARARRRLREQTHPGLELSFAQLEDRLPALRHVLYLVFTEGYFSSHTDLTIRQELCDEALRLTALLAQHPVGQSPETCALMALMLLHRARLSARQNHSGGLLLLEEQNRELWDQHQIQNGLEWLARSATGSEFSRYHAEAGIAAEHCLAASLQSTRWERIVECYATLEKLTASPLHRLNRALAVAQWKGPSAGMQVVQQFKPPSWLADSYLWSATMADLHAREGNVVQAQAYRTKALETAPGKAVRELLERRLDSHCSAESPPGTVARQNTKDA